MYRGVGFSEEAFFCKYKKKSGGAYRRLRPSRCRRRLRRPPAPCSCCYSSSPPRNDPLTADRVLPGWVFVFAVCSDRSMIYFMMMKDLGESIRPNTSCSVFVTDGFGSIWSRKKLVRLRLVLFSTYQRSTITGETARMSFLGLEVVITV